MEGSAAPVFVVNHNHKLTGGPPKVTLNDEQKALLSSSKDGQRLLVSPIDMVCVAVSLSGRHLSASEGLAGVAKGAFVHDRISEEFQFHARIATDAYRRDFKEENVDGTRGS
jgi:hypothetical protein